MKNTLLFFASMLFSVATLSGCVQGDVVDSNKRCETTFKNYDQSVLYYNTVPYGGTAQYQGPTPTRPSYGTTSYYFSGWDLPLENIRKDTTFVAQYSATPITYEITWLNYDNTLLGTSSVEYGKKPSYTGATPTKPATEDYRYVFVGWSPEVVEATENATYVAVFEEQEIATNKAELKVVYSVYNPKTNEPIAVFQTKPSDIGSVSVTEEYDKGSDVLLYADPAEGYTFVGWYYQGHLLSYSSNYNFRVWDKDEEIEARFKYTLYSFTVSASNSSFGRVSFDGSSYGNFYSPTMYYTEEFDLYALTATDIRFIGWYATNNDLISNNAVYRMTMPNHDYSVIGKWNKFYVTYNLNGGYVDSSSLLHDYAYPDSGVRFFELPTPTKTGYLFQYWMVNGQRNTVLDESLLCDFTVEAIWSPITYTVEFNGNGHTSGSMPSMTMTYDRQYNLLNNAFVRTGYTFTGWNTDKDGHGSFYCNHESVINMTSTNNKVITLYAQWEANQYNAKLYYVDPYIPSGSFEVSFESNGGSSVASQTITKSNALRYPTIPTREGYAFTGWYEDPSLTTLYDFSKKVTEDITLYAGWASMAASYYRRSYINALKYNSSSQAYSTSQLYTSSQYTYLYFTAFNTETVSFHYKNSDASSSYYRVYYAIFDATAGSSLSSGSTYSTSYSSTSFTLTAGHAYYIRLYKYSDYYTPTFSFYFTDMTPRADGGRIGSLFKTYSVTYDSQFDFAVPKADGCEFAGWFDKDGNAYTDKDGHSLAAWQSVEKVELFSKWDYIELSISYVLDGGTNDEGNPSYYIVSDNITLKNPTKTGYEFGGWYLESTFENKVTEIKYGNYSQNLTLYAKWAPVVSSLTLVAEGLEFPQSVTVSFESNGGTPIASQTLEGETKVDYPSVPTQNGYAFTGWYEDPSLTTLYDFTKDVGQDITLYAGWVSMATSYYSRSYLKAWGYNSSSQAYSTSQLQTSGQYTYLYFTAFNTETVSFYYKNSSTSSYYRVYYAIYDAITGSSLSSGSTYSTGYSSTSFNVTAGHAYYIRLYKYNASYNPTFSCYFTGMTQRAAGGGRAVTNVYKVENVAYDSLVTIPHDFAREGYKFAGWFDAAGKQYTDENGALLEKWNVIGDITLYAHWEAVS